jgi:hypothetical protein
VLKSQERLTIGRDCFPGLRVSTVQLEAGEYETMIFHRLPNGQCADEIYCERYASAEAAERGHKRLCKLVAAIQEAS